AKVGIDKGLATNPLLGTGLLAGFRSSGESERPGFAWFFGRDALWTALAADAAGAFDTTKQALDFLRKYQRQDGKIPHEVSQSAQEERSWRGLWSPAARAIPELAAVMNDPPLAATATAAAERTRAAMEATYWMAGRGFYAFATARPRPAPAVAEPGPNRGRR